MNIADSKNLVLIFQDMTQIYTIEEILSIFKFEPHNKQYIVYPSY